MVNAGPAVRRNPSIDGTGKGPGQIEGTPRCSGFSEYPPFSSSEAVPLSRNQRQQIAIQQQQAVMTEDLLAITAAPEHMRAGFLHARIEGRKRAAQRAAMLKLCFYGVAAGFIIYLVNRGGSTPSATATAQETAAPTSVASAKAAVTVVTTATPTYTASDDGTHDRRVWEGWFAKTSGAYRTGASWWAGHRSIANPGCQSLQGDAARGCADAKVVLDPFDTRRTSDADYKAGWNSKA